MSINSLMGSLADSIRAKSGVTGRLSIEGMKEAVDAIEIHTGGSNSNLTIDPNAINFIDYDGSVIEQWSLESLASRTALPDNPSVEGLISQGWNQSLEEIKAYNKPNVIGQLYVTSDGKTRFYVSVENNRAIGISLKTTRGTSISWGDDSETENVASGDIVMHHTYAAEGDYVISVDVPTEGSINFYRIAYYDETTAKLVTSSGSFLVRANLGEKVILSNIVFQNCFGLESVSVPENLTFTGTNQFAYCHKLRGFVFPKGLKTVMGAAFQEGRSLEAVALPMSITTVTGYAFYACSKLKFLAFGDNLTKIGAYSMYACSSLSKVILSDGVSQIDYNAFTLCEVLKGFKIPRGLSTLAASVISSCVSISELEIPENITSIANGALGNLAGLMKLKVKAIDPPTAKTTILSNMLGTLVIVVPKGSLASYQSASYWSAYADMMVEEE